MRQDSNGGSTNEARVSVVIPYSSEHTPSEMLERAKQSVKKQSVLSEIIVVEDTEQCGPAWARNQGINQANSRFIAFLDADDEWRSDKLERQLELMNKHNAGICVEGGTDEESGPISCGKFTERILFGDLSSLTSSILINRDSVDVQFRENLDRFEDHLFMIEAAADGDICLVSGPVVDIHKHERGLSARGSPKQVYDARLTTAEYLCEYPKTKPYADQLRQLAHYGLGRQKQLECEYLSSSLPILRSLSYGIDIKALGAFLLIPLGVIECLLKKL